MKKILVISTYFYPHIGGSEKYMEELYSYLKAKNKDVSVDVLCYSTDRFREKEIYKGLNIYRIKGFEILKDQFILPDPVSLLDFLSKHRGYDLVHTSTRFFDSSWWAPLYARLIGAKVVLTDHCAYHPVSSSGFVNLAVRLIEATIVRFSLHFYDGIFAQNKKTKEFLQKNFSISSQVAYPGVNTPGTREKTGKRVKVVYAGRLLKSKGVGDLISFAKEIQEADFIVAGDGALLKKFKKEAGGIKNIKFLGGIEHKEVIRLLKNSDIFVYPSRHSEGLPMALVEAGESKMAVVATNTGAISEIIKDGVTGILIKQGDSRAFKEALIRLVEDKKLRDSLSKKLYEFTVKTFSWDRAANLVLQSLR